MESQAHLPEALSQSRSPAEIMDLWPHWLSQFSRTAEEATHNAPIDCKAGCSFCCHLRIEVWAQEIFFLAQHILQTWPKDRIAQLLSRLQSHASRVLSLSVLQHATTNIPCPLLENGRCSVYAVRPQTCRRLHSTQRSACEYIFDHPEDIHAPGSTHLPSFERLGHAMADAQNALLHAGYDPTIYELGSALHEALTQPDTWSRWIRQDQAFLFASRTPNA